MNNCILLMRTGGTIDAEPYNDPKSPPSVVKTLKGENSLIMSTVSKLPNHENVDGLTWDKCEEIRFVKDSQLFEPDDIKSLSEIISSDRRRYFILTHGTDAMTKNAALLQQELRGTRKIIALVGSMVPLSMAPKYVSDGVEALRFAILNIVGQSPGVHIVGVDSKTEDWEFFRPGLAKKDRTASSTKLVFTLVRSV
jgi:L-asparaginase/Glu-tRNA(Gln) amidotransferase subunit D